MPQFLINSSNIKDNLIIINDKENYHHLTRSLRVKIGEEIKIIDENEMTYLARIVGINSSQIQLNILSSKKSFRKLSFDLTLVQGILHSDAQNFLIQKAVELGVSNIIPFIADNSAISRENAEKKIDKWKKIAFEAFKQCERANIPNISNIIKLSDIDYSIYDKVIVCSEIEREKTLKNLDIKNAKKIMLIVGVEGGFSANEFKFFKNKNFDTISLGNLILKAETAVISAMSTLIYERENG